MTNLAQSKVRCLKIYIELENIILGCIDLHILLAESGSHEQTLKCLFKTKHGCSSLECELI